MHKIVSRVLLLVSVVVLIATSPDNPIESSHSELYATCTSEPLSLTLGPDNMSQELGLEVYNIFDVDSSYFLEFTFQGTYSGEENGVLTLSALDENGVIMEDQVISTELEPSEDEDTVVFGSIGQLELHRSLWIEWDSSDEYSFNLQVEVFPRLEDESFYDCSVSWN